MFGVILGGKTWGEEEPTVYLLKKIPSISGPM